MGLLEGKVVLVTGASMGIGAATALACAQEGAQVITCARNEARGEAAIDAIRAAGGSARFIRADIGDEAEVDRMFAAIRADYGRLDGAVNNAAMEIALAPTADISLDDFDAIVRVNLRGAFHCLREELRIMREQGAGSVVNVTSVAGVDGIDNSGPYCATKHALVGLTKCAAMEMGKLGVRVNNVAPGATGTEMMDEHLSQIAGAMEIVLKKIPMDRIARPAETADSIVWLLSDRSSYITGQTILVDGGMMAGRLYV
jgi:NAD(P)-dependent dehydrogenase (short-subunit alcohol dehydrogenase family)